jgi:hypothetical protein
MNIDVARFWTVVLNSFEVAALAGLLSLAIAFTHRRFGRPSSEAPFACRVAGTIAVIFGVVVGIAGVGHSMAVGSMTLKDKEAYGVLAILRFTTGALLVYSGAMNVALYRAIKAGRRWATGVGIATGLLFCLHLVFVLPLPGTGTSVASALGLWTVYLLWLCAAAFAIRRGDSEAYRVLGSQPRIAQT